MLTVILWFQQEHNAENARRIYLPQGLWQVIDTKIVVAGPTDTFMRIRLEPQTRGPITGAEARAIGQILAASAEQWGQIREVTLTGTDRNPLVDNIPEFPD